MGGFESVRGYLENQLVRDRGIVSSVEFRLPVLFNKAGAGIVHLAPFFILVEHGTCKAPQIPPPSTARVWVCWSRRAGTFPPNSTGVTVCATWRFLMGREVRALRSVSK